MGRKKVAAVTSISDRLCGDELPAVMCELCKLEEDLRAMDEALESLEEAEGGTGKGARAGRKAKPKVDCSDVCKPKKKKK